MLLGCRNVRGIAFPRAVFPVAAEENGAALAAGALQDLVFGVGAEAAVHHQPDGAGGLVHDGRGVAADVFAVGPDDLQRQPGAAAIE